MIAKFAEDTCGYTITSDMVSECKEVQGEKSEKKDKIVDKFVLCLEEEWDCEELEIYFSDSPQDDDTTDS